MVHNIVILYSFLMVLDIYGTPGAETGGAVTLPRRSSPPTNAGVFEA